MSNMISYIAFNKIFILIYIILDWQIGLMKSIDIEKLIVFENEHLIIVNKPASISVHSGSKNEYNLIDLFKKHKNYSKFKNIFLVHRLDKSTSGCLLVAKNINFLRKMQDVFKNQLIIKEYHTVVYGHTKPEFFVKTSCMLLNKYNNKVKSSNKIVVTKCVTLYNYKCFSLLKVFLLTGKLHQIRIHLAHIGHPIVCDNKYGNISLNKLFLKYNINSMFLHAKSISFTCPSTRSLIVANVKYDYKIASLIRVVKSFSFD
ncbi:MAG: RluA family pseudouridine synthase [Candidatus Riesia sp.]|nr:RluA family pseudouridine synthase [Candidatus Riesia sp.]